MPEYITGIQQVGIGVANATEAKYLYRDLFGMSTLVFDDKAAANLMTRYTGSQVYQRRAILTMNMNGGGGFEIWQFTNRIPSVAEHDFIEGAPGINAVKIKAYNIHAAHKHLSKYPDLKLSAIALNPRGESLFQVTDTYANRFQVVEGHDWFKRNNFCMGGVTGAVIGVRDMEKAILFYQKILGNAELIYDITEPHQTKDFSGGLRKVLLRKELSASGAFSRLLGGIDIELVQAVNADYDHLFKNRYWGDCGFIHLCFDVVNMDALKQLLQQDGYPFTVDSAASFAMQDTSGRFCYVEDPDGTLIELVQTHRVPVLKKIGWYINLTNRKSNKPLPNWMVAMLGLNKVK